MSTWQHKKFIIAALSIIILLSIAFIYIAPAFKAPIKTSEQPKLPAIVHPEEEAFSIKAKLPIGITVPEGAGHIVEGFKAEGEDAKVVIHIQDIHTNYEAQKNLSRIIESLIKEKGLKLIMVEGGWGNVSLSYLRSYADKERRLEVGEEYLKAGKISGEEYLDIVSGYEISLEGIEDEEHYKANLNAFFEIEEFRQKAATELKNINRAVEKLKEKIYSPQLLELEKTKADYENEKISLADYYKHLSTLADRQRQDLSGLPNFKEFIKVTELEKHIKFPSVEKERSILIERLSKELSKQRLTVLVTKSLEFRLNKLTPAEYHSYLIKETEEAGGDINAYPNLKKYVDYIGAHEQIDTTRLFAEAEELLVRVKEALITDSRQKRLDAISTARGVLENFLNLKLVPNDFSYYKEHRNDFITANWMEFLNRQLKHNRIKLDTPHPAYTIDRNLSTLVKFYDIANERDDIFVKNTIKLMNEKDQDLSVLIAGGFHTPTLTQKFRECGISYIVVAPHTTQQTDPELYRYILKYKSGREE